MSEDSKQQFTPSDEVILGRKLCETQARLLILLEEMRKISDVVHDCALYIERKRYSEERGAQ